MTHFNTIPAILKRLPQWVLWRRENRRGKSAKVPLQPTPPYRPASVMDSAHGGAFSQAAKTFEAGVSDGIGFVFHEHDPFAGVDLDNCRNAQTGELEQWALIIIGELDSYTEISPSGSGVHIIVQGTLPQGLRRKGHIEMYDKARFFCMTGNHLPGTSTDVKPRQAELERLHARVFAIPAVDRKVAATKILHAPNRFETDEAILSKAIQAKNGPKFTKLWSGCWHDDYPSQSEADLAFCCQLAYWAGGDAVQIDRLFRQSGLFRDKWVHGTDRTYGHRTIQKAIELLKGQER